MAKTNYFLHRHPIIEKKLGVDPNHVIIDKEAWEEAWGTLNRNREYLTNYVELADIILDDSNMTLGNITKHESIIAKAKEAVEKMAKYDNLPEGKHIVFLKEELIKGNILLRVIIILAKIQCLFGVK